MIDWANILTLARSRAGITQIQAAEKTGLSRNTIINFEKGRRIPRADDLELLEKAYGQTFIDLSELNPTPPPGSGGESIVLIQETLRGRSLVGELRRVVDLLANLAIRSDEAGEVLEMAEDVVDGFADEEATQAFVETLRLFVAVASQFLGVVEVREGRVSV